MFFGFVFLFQGIEVGNLFKKKNILFRFIYLWSLKFDFILQYVYNGLYVVCQVYIKEIVWFWGGRFGFGLERYVVYCCVGLKRLVIYWIQLIEFNLKVLVKKNDFVVI